MEQKKKPIYKKWWFWVIIIIAIVAITSSGGDNSNTVVTSGNNAGSLQQEQSTNQTANVGDVVQTDEVKISYKSCKEYTKYNSYSKPKSGNKVMRMEFEFENISRGDILLNTMECYADGEKCEAYYYADDYKSSFETISAGKKVKAVLYYEVPKAAKEIVLEYETDYWSDEKVEFIVK